MNNLYSGYNVYHLQWACSIQFHNRYNLIYFFINLNQIIYCTEVFRYPRERVYGIIIHYG